MYFICSFTLSQIPSEDSKGWSTYLGSTYRTINYDQLLSTCRTYYATDMVPFKAFQPQEFAFYAESSPASPRPSQTGNNPRPSNEQGQPKGKRNNRGGGNPGSRRQESDTTTENTRRKLPRDPEAWCSHCKINGHGAAYCFNKYSASDSTMTFPEGCSSQLWKPPPYSASQPQSPNLTRAPSSNRGQPNPPKQHAHCYTVRAYRCKTTDKDSWIYDSAYTQLMTDREPAFTTFDALLAPVPVPGINGTLEALGEGDVVISDRNYNNHTLIDVCYVPGLNDSIISKNWTKHSGLITTMDQDENFHLQSRTLPFHIVSRTVGKISVFEDIKSLEYPSSHPPTALHITITGTPSDPNPDADIVDLPAPEPLAVVAAPPAVAARRIMRNAPIKLVHQCLFHPSVELMRLLSVKYNLRRCQIGIIGKQCPKPFPSVLTTTDKKLFRVYSDICPVSPETFGYGLYFIGFVDQATKYAWIYITSNRTSSTVR
jgi:hypothetical protein